MENNPSYGIIGPRLQNGDGTMQISCRNFPNFWNMLFPAMGLHKMFPNVSVFSGDMLHHFDHNSIRIVDALTGAFLMVRKTAIDEVGMLDEQFFMYGEEIDWCRRFWNKEWMVIFYPDAMVIHFGGMSSSIEPVRFLKTFYSSQLKYWEKHHGKKGKISYFLIIFFNQLVRFLINSVLYILKPSSKGIYKSNISKHLSIMQWFFAYK
jgi:GT2 family glycosyltransferase